MNMDFLTFQGNAVVKVWPQGYFRVHKQKKTPQNLNQSALKTDCNGEDRPESCFVKRRCLRGDDHGGPTGKPFWKVDVLRNWKG